MATCRLLKEACRVRDDVGNPRTRYQGVARNLKGEENSSFVSSLEREPKTHFEKEKGFSA
jgi:hypothetical protein